MDCCPPKINKIIEFTPPVVPTLRVRPAVHLMTPDQIADLEKGIQTMKNLPEDDPRPKVHCAYCNDAYKQIDSTMEFQVHANALFFPFHRAYLYFFERILCHLLEKPDFAIPFWNWDAPPGMYMPQIYTKLNHVHHSMMRTVMNVTNHPNCLISTTVERNSKIMTPS